MLVFSGCSNHIQSLGHLECLIEVGSIGSWPIAKLRGCGIWGRVVRSTHCQVRLEGITLLVILTVLVTEIKPVQKALD